MINWKDIDLKNRTKGSLKTTCPNCSESRKKKKDPCLSVNIDKGLAKCWHCEETSVKDYRAKKEYFTPPQEWQNYTNLPDKVVEWFRERGISQKTLIENKITAEKYYQPAKQKEMQNIVFNYFEGNRLVNKKYRSADKNFTQTKNAKKIFYGINDAICAKSVYVVEGEMDKLAMWEIGIKNCISVPNGANDLNDVFENCENYLSDVKEFIIAVDCDEAGEKLEQNLVKRLGKWKCKRVKFKGKDANDDLMTGRFVLEQSLGVVYEYPIDGTFTAKDVKDQIVDLYNNGYQKTIKPSDRFFAELNKSFSILLGQLTVITGIPSHGKSNFMEWYLLNLINDNDLRMSMYSPEHFPMQIHHSILAEKVIGRPFHNDTTESRRMTRLEYERYIEWSSNKLYLTAPEDADTPDWDWLLNTFQQQIFRYGIDIFVIDAFNKVKRKNMDSLGEISQILSRLTLFAQQNNVHIFLIAHPTKMQKDESGNYKVPTLYDVKGSGDFYDQTHNGLTGYRHFANDNQEDSFDIITTKLKFKHQGEVNKTINYKFCTSNGRYKERFEKDNFEPIFKSEEEKKDFYDTLNDPPF